MAGAWNVGTATVTIVPSFKGMQRDIKQQMRKSMKAAAPSASQAFVSGAGRFLKKGLKRAFKIGLGGAAAGAGIVGYQGWGRLLNIEDAQAKLKGLGHSVEAIQEVTDRALAAVEGTPYALDEAMTTAAGLLASGVKPGEELEKILGLVADSATIAGVSMGEMGGVWNKIFAGGRVQAQELNQIADRGIPIYQILADHLGVTVDQVRELGAQGKISAQDFAASLEQFEGAAQNAGDTTRGAFANFKTALAKMGADAFEPLQPIIKNLLDDGKAWITEIRPHVTEFSQGIIDGFSELWKQRDRVLDPLKQIAGAVADIATWGWEHRDKIVGWVGALAAAFATHKIITKTSDLAEKLGKAEGAVAKLKAVAPGLADTLGKIGGLLKTAIFGHPWATLFAVIVGGLVLLWTNSETFRNIVIGAFDAVKGAVKALWEKGIKPAFKAISEFVKAAWDNVLKPTFEALHSFVADVLGPVFKWLWETIVRPVWDFIAWHIDAAWNTIRLIFDLLVFAIQHVGDIFRWLWDHVVKPVWEWISSTIKAAWENYIRPVFNAVKGFIYDQLGPAFTWLWETIVQPVWEWISTAISNAWNNGIKPVFQKLKDFLHNTLGPAFERFRDIAAGAFETLANWVLEPVRFIVNTVYRDGIKKAFDSVAEAVGSSATLPNAEIGEFSFSQPRQPAPTYGKIGGRQIRAFARGGYARPGWALVGEEGPELVNFASPGRVYTATQTRDMLASINPSRVGRAIRGKDVDEGLIPDRVYSPAELATALNALNNPTDANLKAAQGAHPSQALLSIGGLWDKAGETFAKAWNGAKNVAATIGGTVVEFVRGGLAKAAELALNPLKELIRNNGLVKSGPIPQLFGDIATQQIDNFISWVRGIDSEDEKAMLAGDSDAVNWAVEGLADTRVAKGGTARPIRGGRLTSRYGVSRAGYKHAGIDLAAPTGTPVFAWRPGVVANAGWNALAGRTGMGVLLAHPGGWGSYYGHLSAIHARRGSAVGAGQVIGRVGSTGRSTGPHLHWEISRGGFQRTINPLPYLHDEGGYLMPGLSALVNRTQKPEPVLTSQQWADISKLALNADRRGDVWVENPWTGEYMKARFREEVDAGFTRYERYR